jgi:tRNA threonylcarbamoyl adenosine modification protein (Sua5/YciO/YrdC/YwlC family)
MNVIPLDRDVPEVWTIRPAAEALRRGELVVVPTDSIYGVACDPWNASAVGDLYKAKGMDHSKRCSVMCADLRSIGAVARAVPNEAFKFMRDHFPGPYTVLLLASRDLPRRATGGRKTIGVRVPDHPVSQALIEDFGGPVLITSLPGWVPGEELDPVGTAERMFIRPTVVLDQGPQFATPSTVIDYTVEPAELVRLGAGAVDLIE